MLGTLLTHIGLPLLIDVVSGSLGKINHPSAQKASSVLKEVDAAVAHGLISQEQLMEANRHIEAMAELKAKEHAQNLAEINKSLRAEIASQDIYVRRMRPTFGYIMAFTWAAQMFGLAYVIIFETAIAPNILQGMASLGAIWAVGLSVLGIYVYKRSEDKKLFSTEQTSVKPISVMPQRKPYND